LKDDGGQKGNSPATRRGAANIAKLPKLHLKNDKPSRTAAH
jgi:hypothetical protein